jgi:integrase
MKLTQRTVDTLTLPPGKAGAIHFDDQLANFGVRLREGGSRMYVVQYKLGGKQRRVTLGSTALLKAEQARDMAKDLLSKVRLGGNPAAEKAEAQTRASETFGAIVKHFLIRQKARLRPLSYRGHERYLLDHFMSLHGLPLMRIDRRTIAGCLSEIAVNSGPAAADRARATLSAFLAWAMKEGLVEINQATATNTHGSKKGRERVSNEGELVEVGRSLGDNTYGNVLRLLILTGQRRAEIGSLRWDEVDLPGRLIRLPGERCKNHRARDVPLSEPAARLLQAVPRVGPFVFGTSAVGFCDFAPGKAILDGRLAAARQAAGAEPMPAWVLHDVRRSVATHTAEIGVQPHIVEAVLNHISGHKTGIAGVYNKATYSAEKRQALDLWAEHVMALVEGRNTKIVPLRAQK